MKLKLLSLLSVIVVMCGCTSYKPESVLEKYLLGFPKERFRWITSESQKRFGEKDFLKRYEDDFKPAEKVLELRTVPTDNPTYTRIKAKYKDNESIKTYYYTLKRDRFFGYRICWSFLLDDEAQDLVNNGQWEEARMRLKEAMQLNPYDDTALALLAEVNMNTDRRKDAWENLQKAMELDPGNTQIFLQASEYWKGNDAEKSKRYAEQATRIAEANFDASPSSDSYASNLVEAEGLSDLHNSLLDRRDVLRENLSNYREHTAAWVCKNMIIAIYSSRNESGKDDLQKDLDDWMKLAKEKYANYDTVRKVIDFINKADADKRYSDSPKGRLEAKVYKVLGDNVVRYLQYFLPNVEDGIKIAAIRGSTDVSYADLSLIRTYDELSWLDKFSKMNSLINKTAQNMRGDQWYTKKRLWVEWVRIGDDVASKVASNF